MAKVPYKKPALTYAAQLAQLKMRGLIVGNEQKALHLLANISYYRLSGYWHPLLQDHQNHIFKPNATFDTAFKLYCFDRELRKMIAGELEKIEVAIRALIIYTMSHKFGPFWYQDSSLFRSTSLYLTNKEVLEKEFSRSDELFLKAFRTNYSDPLPPSWMLLEVISFGTLSKLYRDITPVHERRKIAAHFGLDDRTFGSWLHCLVYIRNICAHHSRLWNKILGIQPRVPLNPHGVWLQSTNIANNRTFFVLSMILYLLNRVNPNHTFISRLENLFAKYPDVSLQAMGFPNNWETENLWK